jgi:hypothetical protein
MCLAAQMTGMFTGCPCCPVAAPVAPAAGPTCSALLIVWGTLVGFWVIWQMKALYYDRKKELVSAK